MLNTMLIKRIKTLQRAAGVDEESYRAMLDGYGVESCKNLTLTQAAEVISFLQKLAGQDNRKSENQGSGFKKRYDDLGSRVGKATPKQLRMLEAMWMGVTRQRNRNDAISAYHAWLRNRFSVSLPEWIEDDQVGKIKLALEEMKNQVKRVS
jgi:hypothetical protein